MVQIMDLPDFGASAEQGQRDGRLRREYNRTEKNREEIESLAPQIMAGDRDAYTRGAVIDKDRADEYQSEHVKRLKQLDAGITYMEEALASKDPLRIAAAWSGGTRPLLATIIKDKPIPEEWSDDMIPAMMKAKAMVQGVQADDKGPGGRVQSRFTNDKGEVMLVMGDNRIVPTGQFAAPNIKILEQEGQVPTGYVTSGGQAGAQVPLGAGGAPAPAAVDSPMAPGRMGAVSDSDPVAARLQAFSARLQAMGLPPAQQQELMTAFEQQQDVVPTPDTGSPPPAPQIVTGGPARTPTSAEKKAAETAATGTMRTLTPDEVAQEGLPPGTYAQRNVLTNEVKPGNQYAQRGANDLTPAQQLKLKKDAAKTMSAIRGTEQSMDLFDKTINQLLENEDGLKGITGLQGMFPNIPGRSAANAQADLDSLKSKVFTTVLQNMRNNSPTGGAVGNVSDREGDKMEANIAALGNSQSYEQFRDRLKELLDFSRVARKNVRAAYADQFGEAERMDDAPADDDISDLLNKYGQP